MVHGHLDRFWTLLYIDDDDNDSDDNNNNVTLGIHFTMVYN